MHDSKIHHDHDMKNIMEFDGFLKESETVQIAANYYAEGNATVKKDFIAGAKWQESNEIDFAISELKKIYKICVATLTYSSNMKAKGAGKIIEDRIKELEKMKKIK